MTTSAKHLWVTQASWRHRFLVALTCIASSHVEAQTKPVAEPTGDVLALPEFTVSDGRANLYRATDAMSAGRVRGQLADTPVSISVVTKEFVQDIGANAMYDVTKYFSGMSNGRGAGIGGIADRHVIRGFENDGRTIDNFGTAFQANFDPAFYERIEVVKGPNSILAPTGTPGGSINIITKSPQFTQANSVAVEVGNFNAQKITFDSTGPIQLSKNLAYRIVGSYQDTRTYLPGNVKQWDISPQLTYQFSERSKVTFKFTKISWGEYGATADANSWGWAVDPSVVNGATLPTTPPKGFSYRGRNGDTVWDQRTDPVDILQGEFTTSLTDKISMRFAGMFYYDRMGQDTGFPTFPGTSNRYDPATGLLTPNYTWAKDATGTFVPTFSPAFDPTNISRIATLAPVWTQNTQVQNDFAGNFKAGGVSIQPLAGWSYVHTGVRAKNLTAPLAPVNLFAPDDSPPHPDLSAYKYNVYTLARTSQKQLYAAVRTGFLNDRLFVTGGASRVWVDNTTTNLLASTQSSLKGHHDTYMGGLLGKPIEGVSLYYNYSSNSSPTSFNNQPLWKDGKEHEYGVKTEFFNQRLSLTAAHFQIVQSNLVTPNPAFNTDPLHNPQNLISNQTNHGIEFEVTGGLTEHLSIIASYTKMKLRDTFNRRPRNIPDETLGGLLNYHFTTGEAKGLNVFAGVSHVGNTAGETPSAPATALGVIEQTSFYVGERTIYNVGAGYTLGRLRFNLNVDNVLNRKYAWQPASRFSVSPYPGINYRLTTTISF